MKKMAAFIGLLLSVVSTIFTIKLLTSFATSGSEQVLYGVFGFAIQGAQTLCFVYACFCIWNNAPGKAVPGLVIWGLLFCLSLAGTIGFFSVNNAQKVEQATAADSNTTLMSDRMKQLDSQIETLTAQSKDFQRRGMLTKGVIPTQSRIAELLEKKEQLSSEYMTYEATPASDALYKHLATFFGVQDTEKVKFWVFVLYSLALDTASVVLLAYSAGLLNFAGNEGGNPFQTPYSTVQGGNGSGGGIGISQGGYAGMNAGIQGVSAQPQHIGMSENTNSPYSTSTVQGYNQTAVHSTVPNTRNTVQHGSTTDSITTDVLLMYISELFPQPERKDGSLKGRRAVADAIGIDQKTADKIHFALKKNGYVRVEGSKTFPNYEQQEMIQAIAGVPQNQAIS
jgi:hypothetical protein